MRFPRRASTSTIVAHQGVRINKADFSSGSVTCVDEIDTQFYGYVRHYYKIYYKYTYTMGPDIDRSKRVDNAESEIWVVSDRTRMPITNCHGSEISSTYIRGQKPNDRDSLHGFRGIYVNFFLK